VVIEIIDFRRIAFNEPENHTPIGPHRYSPEALVCSLESVKTEAGKVHILHGT
jgi:hypothetical protein